MTELWYVGVLGVKLCVGGVTEVFQDHGEGILMEYTFLWFITILYCLAHKDTTFLCRVQTEILYR